MAAFPRARTTTNHHDPMTRRATPRFAVEALEARRLLSISVAGSVVDLIAGRAHPIPDATVVLASGEGLPLVTTTTDANGAFTLAGSFTPDGSWKVLETPPPFFVFSPGETGVRPLADGQVITGMTFYNGASWPDLIVPSAQATISPSGIAGYTKGVLTVDVQNQGEDTAIGRTDLTLYASAPGSTQPSSGDQVIGVAAVVLNLIGGKSREFRFNFRLPTTLAAGSYTLTAAVNTSGAIAESNSANNGAAASAVISVAAPVWDMGLAFASALPTIIPPVKGAVVPVLVTDAGNIPASGVVTLTLYASTDQTLDAGDVPLKTLTMHLNLKQGAQKVMRLAFHGRGKLNTLAAGDYFLIASLTSVLDTNPANNAAVGGTATMFA